MLGEQGVDQLLASLGKPIDENSMEYRQDLARQFVVEVLGGKLNSETLFSTQERARIQAAVEKQKGQKPDGMSGATQKKNAAKGAQPSAEKAGSPSHPQQHPNQQHPKSELKEHPGKPSPHPEKPKEKQTRTDVSGPQFMWTGFNAKTSPSENEKQLADLPLVAKKPSTETEEQRLWSSPEELKSMIVDTPSQQQKLIDLIQAAEQNAENLRISPETELEQITAALDARFIAPSSGGDPLVNPNSIPTGRNLFSINAEQTPTPEAWRVGMQLTDQMLEAHRATHAGDYPRQVAISLWGGEFIKGKGTAIAQILYLMGMRPVWNSRGVVYDVEVIPSEELKRPRVDVLVQTSGQFRDAAATRIKLIDDAVQIASNLDQEEFPNFVREGTEQTEKALKAGGVSAKDARDFATARIFGSASNSSYGTQIMGMVEKGDTWEEGSQVAERYIKNMSGVYRDGDRWGTVFPGLLEAQMQGVDAVVHPRSSNTWGPLSLDHVYEFMGGLLWPSEKRPAMIPPVISVIYGNPDARK